MDNNQLQRINLKAAEISDIEFIEELYFETRYNEFANLGWSPEQVRQFLKMQFEFQRKSYQMQFPDAQYFVITLDNKNAGRLIIRHSGQEVRIIDIAVSAEFQGKGIATKVINEMAQMALEENKKITLNVLKNNLNAFNLYRKLGLTVKAEDDLYFVMEK